MPRIAGNFYPGVYTPPTGQTVLSPHHFFLLIPVTCVDDVPNRLG
jgi:hypothetical protein